MSHGKSKQEVLCDIINAYKNHPSVKQIEKKFNGQNFFGKEKFFFKPVTPPEIEKLIKCLNTNKAAGIDTIPPKLIKIAADFLRKYFPRQLVGFMEEYFSPLISAYRTNYSSKHVIIRLLEEWRKKLDNNFVVGAVLSDLPKAFDCIPHDLLIAKLAAYDLGEEALMYILSYLSLC